MNWIRMDNWWMRSDPPGYNINLGYVGPFEFSLLAYAGAGESAVIIASRVRVPDEPGPRRAAVRAMRDACHDHAEAKASRDAAKREAKRQRRYG